MSNKLFKLCLTVVVIILLLVIFSDAKAKSYVWIMNEKVIGVGSHLNLVDLEVGIHDLMLYITENDPNYITIHEGIVTVGTDPNNHSFKWGKYIKYKKP